MSNRTVLTTFVFLIALVHFGIAQDPFITTWQTDNPGTSDSTSITIPTIGGGYNYDIDWTNDGMFDTLGVTGTITHDFGAAGTYQVAIRGDFPRILFAEGGDKDKILSIDQWGDIAWTSFTSAFSGCENLVGNFSDVPDLSNVTSTFRMFRNAFAFDGDLSAWDVSNVTDMQEMFYYVAAFNADISAWNVSNVTDMGFMFLQATSFDQDISGWDVSNVTDMAGMFNNATQFNQDIGAWNISNVSEVTYMFYQATNFNGDISAWNVSNVINMTGMFNGASQFNQDIGAWNVSNVTNMKDLFWQASAFNGDISGWNVSNVTNMSRMFRDAVAFNGDLSAWDVSNVNDCQGMFDGVTLFNGDLSGWNVSNVTDMSLMFQDALAFNGNIGNWDVSNVNNMNYVFSNADIFNGDISGWDVSNVMSMQGMFFIADSFDQDLGSWDIGSVADMNLMFAGTGMSSGNYDNTLIGWESRPVQSNVTLTSTGLIYCCGEDARDRLITNSNWTINADSRVCGSGCAFDSTQLNQVFDLFGGENWIDVPNWTSENMDEWEGVSINEDGYIDSLTLPARNVAGDVGLLAGLELRDLIYLNLSDNLLTDTIPDFQGLPNLRYLDLGKNPIRGPVPDFTGIDSLEEFHLRETNVNGVPDFGNNMNIRILDIGDNPMLGSNPDFNIAGLKILKIDGNGLDDIPCFSIIEDLDILHVQNNLVSFEDIICNSAAVEYIYSPQDSVGAEEVVDLAVGDDYTLQLDIDADVTSNVYQWLKDGIELRLAAGTTLELTDVTLADAGVYNCQVTNTEAIDLILYSRPIALQITSTGITDQSIFTALTVSPMPFSDHLQMEFSLSNPREIELALLDMSGREVHSFSNGGNFGAGNHTINLEIPLSLQAGMYILSFSSDDEQYGIAVVK